MFRRDIVKYCGQVGNDAIIGALPYQMLGGTLKFYQDIAPFHEFSDVAHEKHFFDVPETWYVVLTDVRGSTEAIRKGQYKNVNVIGAASITCVLNCLKDFSFPFVFGGDGATMLIPSEFLEKAKASLNGLQKLAVRDFNLELRVGMVSVKTIYDQGYKIKVGKFQLSPGNCLAQFCGNGLTLAETMVKSNDPSAELLSAELGESSPELQGLSCRLSPFNSKKGTMLSILCRLQVEDNEFFVSLLASLEKILDGDFKSVNPVTRSQLKWRVLPQSFAAEVNLLKKKSHFLFQLWGRLFWVVLSNLSLILEFPLGPFKPKKYKDELVLNSDSKKFDETLRMVIDCSEKQAEQIEQLFRSLYLEHKVFYGIHKSKQALMTCMVFSASENQHIHFIDGADGGYALAAVKLKAQMKMI